MTYVNARIASSALAIAIALGAPAAHAEGVLAGTLIENTATATFDDNGTPRTVDSNTVSVTVDELLDVTAVSQDAGAVPVGDGSAVLTYEVTNTGNGPEAFNLTADPNVTGNDFNVTIDGIALDTNGNGTYDPGVDRVLGAGEATPSIDPDNALTVFVLVTAPGGVSDGDTSAVNLLAEADTGTGTPGTVFANQGEGGGDAVVGTTGADADADGPLVVAIATLSLTKAASVADPFGGTETVPGATITYTITANVSGTGSITGLRITDPYPDDTTYEAGTLTLDAAPLTDAADGDAGSADATGIDVLIGEAAAGSSYAITFDVTID